MTALPPAAEQVHSLISYLEHEPHPSIVLDTNYTILAANSAYQRQFGAPGAHMVGLKCYQVSHHYDAPCDQSGEHCPMKKAQESRGADRVLHVHHTPRGPQHVDVELRPILDARQNIVAYVEKLCTVRSAYAQPSEQGLVGSSPLFNQALAAVQRVGPSALPVLLLGESGSGKELFAKAVHEASTRARGPFVVVECSGLTDSLFESELFGYEKGAFTGALARKKGLVETAQGGSLFLDEMGDIPLTMQVKLLRLLESGTFRRVGGIETLQSDFRLIAATHKPVQAMVAQGLFRQDLYYRISAFPIALPALRERKQDIALLVESMLRRGGPVRTRMTVQPDAMERLIHYHWPGNIRELRNVLDRAKLFADDGVIRPEHLPDPVGHPGPPPLPDTAPPAAAAAALLAQPSQLENQVRQFRGTRKALAQSLGISERSLYRRLTQLKRSHTAP
jgi:transcriptional regulator with PAS, ATPase and Fis domain